MAISGVAKNHVSISDSEGAPGTLPAEADVAWFNVQMQQAARPINREPSSSPMTQAAASLQKHAVNANRDLQRASRSIDPQEALHANRSLSSFYLESLLSAKLVSKAAQSVEKLTSLQ